MVIALEGAGSSSANDVKKLKKKHHDPADNEPTGNPSDKPLKTDSQVEEDDAAEEAFMRRAHKERPGAQQVSDVIRHQVLSAKENQPDPPADPAGDTPDDADGGGTPAGPTADDIEAEDRFMHRRAKPTPVSKDVQAGSVTDDGANSAEDTPIAATITGFGEDGSIELAADGGASDVTRFFIENAMDRNLGYNPNVALSPAQTQDAVPQDADQTMQYLYDHHSEIDRSQRPDGIIDKKELYDYIASHQNIGEIRNVAFLQGNDMLFSRLANRFQEGGPGRNDDRGISLLDLQVAAESIGPAQQGTVEEKAAQLSVALTGQFGQVSTQQVLQGTAPRPGEATRPAHTGLTIVGTRSEYNALYNTVAAIANNTTPFTWTDDSGKSHTLPANAGQQLLNWVAQNAAVEVSVNPGLDSSVAGIVGFNGDGVYHIQLRDPNDATFLLHESMHVFTRQMGLDNSLEEEMTATIIGSIADPINKGRFVPDYQAPRNPDGSYKSYQQGDRVYSLPELAIRYGAGYAELVKQSPWISGVGDFDSVVRRQFGWVEGVNYPTVEP